MDTLGSRIRAARTRKKMTQEGLGKATGVSRVSVTQWEKNQTRPEASRMVDVAKALGVSIDFLETGANGVTHSNISPYSNAQIIGKLDAEEEKIPVYGQVVGGVWGEFELNGNVLYEVMSPPGLSKAKGAYAVRIAGDSMSPRYEDGEVAYVDPTARVRKGDYVVAEIVREEHGPRLAFVKRFVSHNSKELVLEQLNPAETLRFPHETVRTVHYIVMAGSST